jgi:hypothetical protein
MESVPRSAAEPAQFAEALAVQGGSYDANWLLIDAFQTLLLAPMLGAAVAVGFVIWRRFRRRGER